MKMKFARNAKSDRRELVVAVQRGEALDEKRAKVLAQDTSALLLPFSFENTRMGTMLRYDVEGLWSLRTFLAKRPMGVEELMGLLRAVDGVLEICTEKRLRQEGLFFDPEYVFVNAQCCPHFALIPLEEMPFQERNSPLALLKALGGADRLQFATPDAEGLSKRIATFVVDQGGVFSANTFRRLLENEAQALEDVTPAPEVRRTVVDEGKASWATAGAAAPAGAPADSGAFFWNPLMGMVPDEDEKPEPVPAAPPAPVVTAPAPAQPPVPAPVAVEPPKQEPEPTPAPEPVPAPPPAPQPVRSAILVRPSTGEQFPLALGAQVQLGRGSACGIRLLGNPKLSRAHASIVCDGQTVRITDLGAANGVWVGGMRLQSNQTAATSVDQQFRLADEDLYVHVV